MKPFIDQKFLITLILISFLTGVFLFGFEKIQQAKAELVLDYIREELESLAVLQKNSLLAVSQPVNPDPQVVKKVKVIITAYSSSTWETDEDPYITAAGTWVREGIVANNLLSFGTRIRIPEVFGEKIFIVEDRMNREKGKYHVDIWFPDYWQALSFGAKSTYIEVLEG